MTRVFTLRPIDQPDNYAEFAMLWRGAATPTLEDFKNFWGDQLYQPWHEKEEIVELKPV